MNHFPVEIVDYLKKNIKMVMFQFLGIYMDLFQSKIQKTQLKHFDSPSRDDSRAFSGISKPLRDGRHSHVM